MAPRNGTQVRRASLHSRTLSDVPLAQAIYDSLTLLASLRPRSSADAEVAPLVPTPAALRMLHRTLPIGKSEGWHGTLPPTHSTTLRDDTTLHIKSGATVPAPAAPAAVVTAAPAPATAKTPAPAYPNYAYPNYPPSAQYRSGYGSYTSGQTSSYYPNYASQSATAQTPGPTQYPSQYGTTGQQSYAYSSWYNYQGPPTPAAGPTAAGSGRATPQIAPAAPTNYSGYYPAAATQSQPQRAVANTVVTAAAKQYSQAGWTNGATATPYVPPTIPPHIRGQNGATSTPGTPTPTSTTTPYQSYYANYQPTPTAAR